MGWKVDLVRKHGGFTPSLGMAGNKLGVAEETELLDRIRANEDVRVVFLPRMEMLHLVPAYKFSMSYQFRRYLATARIPLQPCEKDLINEVKSLAGRCVRLISGTCHTPFRDKTDYPYWQNYFYEVVSPLAARTCAQLESIFRSKRDT